DAVSGIDEPDTEQEPPADLARPVWACFGRAAAGRPELGPLVLSSAPAGLAGQAGRNAALAGMVLVGHRPRPFVMLCPVAVSTAWTAVLLFATCRSAAALASSGSCPRIAAKIASCSPASWRFQISLSGSRVSASLRSIRICSIAWLRYRLWVAAATAMWN